MTYCASFKNSDNSNVYATLQRKKSQLAKMKAETCTDQSCADYSRALKDQDTVQSEINQLANKCDTYA